MTNMKQYKVYLDSITDSERVLFKLIFSVSQRSKLRDFYYQLTDAVSNANIVINRHDSHHVCNSPHVLHIQYDKNTASNPNNTTLTAPLIATRVLNFLDERITKLEPLESLLDDEEYIEPSRKENYSSWVNFDISEDEASTLAIVEDEELSNPENASIPIQNEVTNQEKNTSQFTQNVIPLPQKDTDNSNETATPRVLVVDDSASVRKQLELELDLFICRVDFAENSSSAYELLKKNKYELVFLDVVLPDEDGFQICKQIKADSKMTKVVMLTGKATPSDKVRGSLAGCDAYLVKPVGRMTFQQTTKQYLEMANIIENANLQTS